MQRVKDHVARRRRQLNRFTETACLLLRDLPFAETSNRFKLDGLKGIAVAERSSR